MTVVAPFHVRHLVTGVGVGGLSVINVGRVVHFEPDCARLQSRVLASRFQFYSSPFLIVRVPARSARSFITAKKTGTRIST